MDAKEAVSVAKNYVVNLLSTEEISNLGLEELERTYNDDGWEVTVGFSRPWNTVKNTMTMITGDAPQRRTYRVVKVKDTGDVVSFKRRENSE